MTDVIALRQQQALYDQKWRKFLHQTWLFKYIPFVEFVLGSGSIALGNVNEDSDFDVIVGTRAGRIFTARFLCAVAFGLFGWRRSKIDHNESAKDKVCFNHFVTKSSYRLSVPANEYFIELYKNLVPIYGSEAKISEFLLANSDWLGQVKLPVDSRHLYREGSKLKSKIENWLLGNFGNRVEKFLKEFQIKRIEKGFKSSEHTDGRIIVHGGAKKASYSLPALIRYSDTELKFHPDPVKIEIN